MEPRPLASPPPAPATPATPPSRTPPAAVPPYPESPALPPNPGTIPEGTQPILDMAHQLPPHRGKLERMTDHAQGVMNGITDWIELRIALVKREISDLINGAKEKAIYGAILAILVAVAGMMILIAIATALGAFFAMWMSLLAGLALGCLVVALVTLGIAAFVLKKSPFRSAQEAGMQMVNPASNPQGE